MDEIRTQEEINSLNTDLELRSLGVQYLTGFGKLYIVKMPFNAFGREWAERVILLDGKKVKILGIREQGTLQAGQVIHLWADDYQGI